MVLAKTQVSMAQSLAVPVQQCFLRLCEGLQCQCSMSDFCYQPVGHVVTGDLTIIRDAKLRHLIAKGPSYREQNVIDWTVNAVK